jgi:DNA-binding CsgD family transcriptional regulator
MFLSKEEKERLVLELYYEKGYTYRQIAKELHMSPNQIQDVKRRHEEKTNAKANKKKELSLYSKAYKLFSKGKTNVEVAILLDISQPQVTQFQYQYWKLIGQDKLVILHSLLGDRIFSFSKLYKELIIKGEMSIERIINLIETALDKLPYVEDHYEQAKQAADKQQERLDYLENRIRTLDEKRNKTVILSPSHYHYPNDSENYASKSLSHSSRFSSQPSSLPNLPSAYSDLSNEYNNEQENSRKKKEIRGVREEDTVV